MILKVTVSIGVKSMLECNGINLMEWINSMESQRDHFPTARSQLYWHDVESI